MLCRFWRYIINIIRTVTQNDNLRPDIEETHLTEIAPHQRLHVMWCEWVFVLTRELEAIHGRHSLPRLRYGQATEVGGGCQRQCLPLGPFHEVQSIVTVNFEYKQAYDSFWRMSTCQQLHNSPKLLSHRAMVQTNLNEDSLF